jgi:hypothetical protein
LDLPELGPSRTKNAEQVAFVIEQTARNRRDVGGIRALDDGFDVVSSAAA